MTFSHKRIAVALLSGDQLGGAFEGDKTSGGGGNAIFDGLRTHVRIVKAGGAYMGTAEITIYGLSMSHINELSTWGTAYHPTKNFKISVKAGDPVNGMSQVFLGTVTQAWADFSGMPDVPMTFLAVGTTAVANVGTVQPTSFSGSTEAAPLVQKLSLASGQQFENSGVNARLDGGYFWGSPWKQMKEIADAVNANIFQDDGVVALWPKDKPRQGDTLLVSAQTGMRDYPSFTQFGVLVKVEFKKTIKYGTTMTIKSDLERANGNWMIASIDYDLQSETPNGNWFAIITGIQFGAPITGLFN